MSVFLFVSFYPEERTEVCPSPPVRGAIPAEGSYSHPSLSQRDPGLQNRTEPMRWVQSFFKNALFHFFFFNELFVVFCFYYFIALISEIFPSRPAPATSPRFPRHTPTAPYTSAWAWMDRKMKKNRRKRRTRPTGSQLKTPAAENTTAPDSSTHLCTSCSTAARSRPQPPARGIWTARSMVPWLTAGDRHPRTTSHQAGLALGAHRRDPSLRMVTLTRR